MNSNSPTTYLVGHLPCFLILLISKNKSVFMAWFDEYKVLQMLLTSQCHYMWFLMHFIWPAWFIICWARTQWLDFCLLVWVTLTCGEIQIILSWAQVCSLTFSFLLLLFEKFAFKVWSLSNSSQHFIVAFWSFIHSSNWKVRQLFTFSKSP